MNQFNNTPFQGLRFAPGRRGWPWRLILVALAAVVFTLLWWLLPPPVAYCLLVLPVLALTWVASYGWRQALATLIALLHRLEEA